MSVLETAKADRTAAAENVSTPPQQVLTTPAAVALMETLRAKYGPLMFHQSGGCCDGSLADVLSAGRVYDRRQRCAAGDDWVDDRRARRFT